MFYASADSGIFARCLPAFAAYHLITPCRAVLTRNPLISFKRTIQTSFSVRKYADRSEFKALRCVFARLGSILSSSCDANSIKLKFLDCVACFVALIMQVWLTHCYCLVKTRIVANSVRTIIPPDKREYSNNIFFLFLHENICCGYSLEAPQRGASNEYPQHMVL